MKYPEFKVESNGEFVGFASGKDNDIIIDCLPGKLRRIFQPGVYTVQRVSRLHNDIIGVKVRPVRSADHLNYHDIPALYTDSMGMLCKRLCKLIGYKAEKPETIYVKIKRLNSELLPCGHPKACLRIAEHLDSCLHEGHLNSCCPSECGRCADMKKGK